MNANLTDIQNEVTDALVRKGFTVDSIDDARDEVTVLMSKRVNRHSSRYAEVDCLGLVNGIALSAFLNSLNA